MSALDEALDRVTTAVNSNGVDVDMLRGLNLGDIVTMIGNLVSEELMHLSGLSDDAEANEQALRTTIQNAAFKAFLTGLLLSGQNESPDPILVEVPSEALEAIGLSIIRDGYASFALVAGDE